LIIVYFHSTLHHHVLDADDHCYQCGRSDDMEVMLICDRCSFYCCHIYCCNPPLESIPLEDWFCKFCEDTSNRRRQRREQREHSNSGVGLQNNNSNSARLLQHRSIVESTSTRTNSRNNQDQSRDNSSAFFGLEHQSQRNSTNRTQEQTNTHRPQTRRATRLANNDIGTKSEARYLTRSRTVDLSTTTISSDRSNLNNMRNGSNRYSRK
jgi:hypothetical protein